MSEKKYSVLITKTAEKQLKKIPAKFQQKIAACIWGLSIDPFPFGYKKLTGFDDTYRIRIANYRVIYIVDGKEIIVTVLKIGHRKDVYG